MEGLVFEVFHTEEFADGVSGTGFSIKRSCSGGCKHPLNIGSAALYFSVDGPEQLI